ncbi:sensor histidine kinase [Dactylosporangium sp. CA-152071]|uniref:sensor histidine kinase n=1 Tax=Dactylosporangium sp. CA-152071 TaxID=3239933 RepID=UPI003D91D250
MELLRRPRVADALLACGLAVAMVLLRQSAGPPDWPRAPFSPADPVTAAALWALLVAQAAPMLWRRTHPWAVMAAVSVAYVAFELVDPAISFRDGLPLGFGVYAVARYAPPPASLLSVAVAGLAMFGHDLLLRPITGPPLPPALRPGVIEVTVAVGLVAGLWQLGRSQRHIHSDAAALRDLTALLRAEQQRSAARAVTAERARIARDLHDLVAHHVSAIAVQARATAEALPEDTALAGRGVAGIGTAADTALLEMRRLLRLLSDDDAARDLLPEPSLAHLRQLTGVAAAAGCEVDLDVSVGPDVPAAVQVSAYRVVQEALTNALKHAGPVAVRVAVHQRKHQLEVGVVNDPPVAGHQPMPGAGLGLIGMRERVALFGGTLSTGPLADGRWRVEATFPWEGEGGP